MVTDRELRAFVRWAAVRRIQTAFHAIGDRAVHELLNVIESAQVKFRWIRDLRWRIEHAQLILPDDIPRIRELGLLASVQPTALTNPEKDRALLGSLRASRAYPYRSLLRAGVPLSFGSDIGGESTYHPLTAIYYAVSRTGRAPSGENITPLEALTCYTKGSAFAEFMEKEKGTMTVLSDDPLAVETEGIKDIRVEMTIVGGRVVMSRL